MVPLMMAVVLFLVVLFADDWLESKAGTSKLETALANSLGMPVSLRGDLSISLLPSVGVDGTELSIGATAGGRSFIESSFYHVDIALLPLIDGKLRILSLSAKDGTLDMAQYQSPDKNSETGSSEEIRLPEIERLEIENFRIKLPGKADNSLLVHNLELLDFRAGQASPLQVTASLQSRQTSVSSISIDSRLTVQAGASQLLLELLELGVESAVAELQGINGHLSWSADSRLLTAELVWPGDGRGPLRLSSSHSTASYKGDVRLEYAGVGMDVLAIELVGMEAAGQGIDFPAIQVSLGSQQVTGSGCLLTEEPVSLNFLLESEYLDLDQIGPLFAGGGSQTGDAPEMPLELPIEVNGLLSAREVHSAGVTAYQSEIRIGRDPDCRMVRNDG